MLVVLGVLQVTAVAYDNPIPGFDTRNCINLRLWAAKPAKEFDLEAFNTGEAREQRSSSGQRLAAGGRRPARTARPQHACMHGVCALCGAKEQAPPLPQCGLVTAAALSHPLAGAGLRRADPHTTHPTLFVCVHACMHAAPHRRRLRGCHPVQAARRDAVQRAVPR